jgi:hypothetical protein
MKARAKKDTRSFYEEIADGIETRINGNGARRKACLLIAQLVRLAETDERIHLNHEGMDGLVLRLNWRECNYVAVPALGTDFELQKLVYGLQVHVDNYQPPDYIHKVSSIMVTHDLGCFVISLNEFIYELVRGMN